jgi:hypothetical protein
MNNYEDAMQYINKQEATEISYVKVGDNNKKLIVSFSSNGTPKKDFFQRKKSLMEPKYKRNDFDVLYLRNQSKWYLGSLNGIGKNINHTIAFLRKEFAKYDKVLCMGNSAGGYASLLFGSLLKVNNVIALNAQTDLQYLVDNLPKNSQWKKNLIKRAKECPATWSKYNKIVKVLNENVIYDVAFKGDENCEGGPRDLILHGDYHYDQIRSFPSVSKFDGFFALPIKKFLENK